MQFYGWLNPLFHFMCYNSFFFYFFLHSFPPFFYVYTTFLLLFIHQYVFALLSYLSVMEHIKTKDINKTEKHCYKYEHTHMSLNFCFYFLWICIWLQLLDHMKCIFNDVKYHHIITFRFLHGLYNGFYLFPYSLLYIFFTF